MRLPRLRIRTLMLLVGVVALALAIRAMRDRRQEYLWIRDHYARDGFLARRTIDQELASRNPISEDPLTSTPHVTDIPGLPGASRTARGPDVAKLEGYRKLLKYYGEMRAKYEYAAAHPWLIVPPDPPEPEIPE